VLDLYPNEVKLVIKHFPLKSHKLARKSALAALAAFSQGKFWEFHHGLFENQKDINDAKIQEIAEELNLNMEKFNSDMKSSAIENLINRDVKDGMQIGIRGIPAVFINGKLLKNIGFSELANRIESELEKK
jgi:protein-disulfide isomerase